MTGCRKEGSYFIWWGIYDSSSMGHMRKRRCILLCQPVCLHCAEPRIFDGVVMDYEGNVSTTERQDFLSSITTGFRASLPCDSLVLHVPMDFDLTSGQG